MVKDARETEKKKVWNGLSVQSYREDDGLPIIFGCPICRHAERDGIETIGALASIGTWAVAARRINNTFKTGFSPGTVKNHMTNHPLHREVSEQQVIMDSIKGTDGAPAVSPKRLLDTLLFQGALDVSKGYIKPTSVSELMAVLQMSMNIADREDRMRAANAVDAADFYAVMGAYAEAMRATLPPATIAQIVAKAQGLGVAFDIQKLEQQPVQGIDMDEVMERAVEDYRKRGLLPAAEDGEQPEEGPYLPD